jgi:hypothetical protein
VATNVATKLIAAALVWSSLLAPTLALADPSQYGKQLYNSDDFKLYYRVEGNSVFFSAILPATWSYMLAIDADRNGVWGYGPYDKTRKSQDVKTDFAYNQTREGRLCPQYIDNADPNNPDAIYMTSDCGGFHSHGSMRTRLLSGNQALKTYIIPKGELPSQGDPVHMVVSVWDGRESHYLQTLSDPILLKI